MRARLVLMLLVMFLVVACGKGPDQAAARKQAFEIWTDRCANCHGMRGAADGPQARLLDPPPRKLNDRAWQSTVTDEHLRKVIVDGGQSVGKSPLMAANPDLSGKPEVLDALVAYVRTL